VQSRYDDQLIELQCLHQRQPTSKAEVRAAYDQRCRRRMAATQRLNLHPSNGASNLKRRNRN